jgi:5-formyltetrahydrofolate cyclo-ligase
MDKQELKNRLMNVSSQLQQITRSNATISKLIDTGKVRVVEIPEKQDAEPAALNVTGQEAVQAMLMPVLRELNAQKERLLNAKEALLNALEKEVGDVSEPVAESEKTEEQTTDSEKKPKKKDKE